MQRFALASILVMAVPTFAADEPSFTITTQKKEDSVEPSSKDGTTHFTVKSASGIGSATIKRVGDKWPDRIILKLNLGSMEGFNARAGKMSMHAFVNTSSMKSVTFENDGKKIEGYDAKHPLWTEIKIFGPDGKPSDLGYFKGRGIFEIALPKAFFESNPDTLSFHWIDAYRR